MTTHGHPNQTTQKLRVVRVGGCDSWTNFCAHSPTSLYEGGVVWCGEGGQSLVTVTMSSYDCVAPSLKYAEWGLRFFILFGQRDLIQAYSYMSHRYWNFIWLFRASKERTQKCCQNSIIDSCGAFCCCNIFLSSALGSKWWKTNSIRSLNCLNDYTQLGGSVRHHSNGYS